LEEKMIINVDKLPQKGLKVSRNYEFSSEGLVEESAVFLQSVQAELIVKKAGEDIFIKGNITTLISFVCSRCIIPFEFPVDSKFDLVYLPGELDVMKDHLEGDDINELYYYENKIDIREVILEQLNLSFPAKPLCSENCAGICPVCGKIISSSKCACVKRISDPRLDKLKMFIRDKS